MAVKTKKQRVFQDPDNSDKLIVESISEPYSSSFLIVRNEKGEICAPWVTEEMAQIKKKGTMQYGDVMGLENHRRWARKNAQEKARGLARGLQGQLF